MFAAIFMIVGSIIAIVLLVFVAKLIGYHNEVELLKQKIKKSKSQIGIVEEKYLQTLKRTKELQKQSLLMQSEAYKNATREGVGIFNGGAMGSIDASLNEASQIIKELATEYEISQKQLNDDIIQYNSLLVSFPNSVFARMLGYETESYIKPKHFE